MPAMTEPTLNLEAFTLGPWQTNCYVLWVGDGPDCWVVDAGFEPQPMIERIAGRGLRPTRLLLTHGHLDHIAGLAALKQRWPDALIAIHPAEREFLTDPRLNLSTMLPEPVVAPPADLTLDHGQVLALDGVNITVLHTPGHSPGGVVFHQPQRRLALVGDTLFAGSIGRTDFPTADGPTLLRSIREQLLSLPDETRLYPGHGPDSTIGSERRGNPFL